MKVKISKEEQEYVINSDDIPEVSDFLKITISLEVTKIAHSILDGDMSDAFISAEPTKDKDIMITVSLGYGESKEGVTGHTHSFKLALSELLGDPILIEGNIAALENILTVLQKKVMEGC